MLGDVGGDRLVGGCGSRTGAPGYERVELPAATGCRQRHDPRVLGDRRRPRVAPGIDLFIDAREIYSPVDRTHRAFTEAQLELIANIARMYRGEEPELAAGENALFAERFPDGTYEDVPGLCKVATIAEIEEQDWSLNPSRYVGTEVEELDDEVFEEKLAAAQAELRSLGERARELEDGVDHVLTQLLAD